MPLVPKRITYSAYGIATLYAAADCVDKGSKANRTGEPLGVLNDDFLDTGAWQLLASLLVPTVLVSAVRRTSSRLLGRAVRRRPPYYTPAWWTSERSQRALSAASALAVLPFFAELIDNRVDWFMDTVYFPLAQQFRDQQKQQEEQPPKKKAK